MRVKLWDVAMITRGLERNIGKLVVVVSLQGDVDYSNIGYGVLTCWYVESLSGGDLTDREGNLRSCGYIPDVALTPIAGIDGEVLRKTKAQHDFDAELKELGEVLRCMDAREKAEKAAQTVIKKAAKIKRRTAHG